ncbi:hypothetical protein [Microbacterium sp. NPDC087665]|uniref:hypothetical protein n=1 Tax=Microbacterium sp. NPDC087665 TaxID=3364194 RepID=UPI00381B2C37
MTEHETPENPPQTGPATPNEQPETAASEAGEQAAPPTIPAAQPASLEESASSEEPASSEDGAPGYPVIPPALADPLQTLSAPNTAGFFPGGHQLPQGVPQPTPFDPDRGYAPGPVPAPSPLDPALAPGPLPEQTPDGFGPNKKLPTGALIGVIAGGIIAALVLAAVIIIPLANRGGGASGDSSAPESSTPEEFVEGYLNAVAEGDADAAITYLDTSSYSTDLLTDEVLKSSLELGPIDDIEVGEATAGDYTHVIVPATFTIGGEEVTREFEMYQSEYNGDITMYNGAARVANFGFGDIGLTVNGVEVPDDALVFPGTYELNTALEEFTIEGETTLVFADEKSEEALLYLRPELSDAGVAAYRELVTTSLRECLAMKTLSTPCGLDVTSVEHDGYVAVDGTVTRVLSTQGETALAGLTGKVVDRAVVSKFGTLSVDMTLEGQNAAGQRSQIKVSWGAQTLWGSQMLAPKVDFAAETPTVVWE